MNEIRFVHAADLHIDSPFKGLKETGDDLIAQDLRGATFGAFQELINLCEEIHADFLVIAGDIFDQETRSIRGQIGFREGLGRLAARGIQSFVVHGNHDPIDGNFAPIRDWPEGVHIFDTKPTWAMATRNGSPIANIQGVSYREREVKDNLAEGFVPPPSNDLFNIGLLHCNLGGNTDHDNYAPCTVNDLLKIDIGYWALGHVHTRQEQVTQKSTIVYPGNIQGRNPRERGEHGCVIVNVKADGSVDTEFRALDSVRWERAEISIEGLVGIEELHSRISLKLDELRSEASGRKLVCSLVFKGRGPLHKILTKEDLRQGFRDLLDEYLQKKPWLWVERLEIETRPEIDLETRSTRDDFLGELLRRAEESDPEQFVGPLSLVFSKANPLPTDEVERRELIKEFIVEAKWLLVEKLDSEEES